MINIEHTPTGCDITINFLDDGKDGYGRQRPIERQMVLRLSREEMADWVKQLQGVL